MILKKKTDFFLMGWGANLKKLSGFFGFLHTHTRTRTRIRTYTRAHVLRAHAHALALLYRAPSRVISLIKLQKYSFMLN